MTTLVWNHRAQQRLNESHLSCKCMTDQLISPFRFNFPSSYNISINTLIWICKYSKLTLPIIPHTYYFYIPINPFITMIIKYLSKKKKKKVLTDDILRHVFQRLYIKRACFSKTGSFNVFVVCNTQILISSPLAFRKLYCSAWKSDMDCTLKDFPYFRIHLNRIENRPFVK